MKDRPTGTRFKSAFLASAARCLAGGCAVLLAASAAAAPTTIPLWPGRAPGEQKILRPESDLGKATDRPVAGRPVALLGNVSDPTITLYRPDPAIDTGAAVLVCPGGGYFVLAMDLEGTEVCAWLNSIGVTGILLKYRVPRRDDRAPGAAPLQDAQRALGLVRSRAAEFGLDPHRIGVLGFSAGGNLAALLSNHPDPRTYPAVDPADAASCRPDFCVLIYPAYLVGPGPDHALAPGVSVGAASTPPTFLVMTEDDNNGVENVLFYYLALKNAGVPAEMHLYPRGGHGYGLRRTADTVTIWPDRCAEWLHAAGFLPADK
jgi:acetyl esterase/lipase